MIRGEPSDRRDLVQNDMRQTDRNYEVLKEALKDEEWRRLSGRMLHLWWEAEQRGRAAGRDDASTSPEEDGHGLS